MSDTTGIAPVDAVVVWSIALTAIITLLTMIWRGLRKITKKTGHILDAWNGEEPRPGVPGRPPLMQRVGDLETGLQSVKGHAAALETRVGGVERSIGSRLLDGDQGGGLRPQRSSG